MRRRPERITALERGVVLDQQVAGRAAGEDLDGADAGLRLPARRARRCWRLVPPTYRPKSHQASAARRSRASRRGARGSVMAGVVFGMSNTVVMPPSTAALRAGGDASRSRGRRGRADGRAGRSGRAARAGRCASMISSAVGVGGRADRGDAAVAHADIGGAPRPRAGRRCRCGSAGRNARSCGLVSEFCKRLEHVARRRAGPAYGRGARARRTAASRRRSPGAARRRGGTARPPRPGSAISATPGCARHQRRRAARPAPAIQAPTGTVKPCFGANGSRLPADASSSQRRSSHLPAPSRTFSPSGRRNAAAATAGSRNGVRPSTRMRHQAAVELEQQVVRQPVGDVGRLRRPAAGRARRSRPRASAAAMPSRQPVGRARSTSSPSNVPRARITRPAAPPGPHGAAVAAVAGEHLVAALAATAPPSRPAGRGGPGTRSG